MIIDTTFDGYRLTVEKIGGVTLYSQCDPRWRNLVYAGGTTFCKAGCYVVSVAMMLSLAGYDDTPPNVAAKLRAANCFSGNLLTRPDRIPNAYPRTSYHGTYQWHDRAADMSRIRSSLKTGPVIIEVDFRPGLKFNQHFVVAKRITTEGDIIIADPQDGTRTKLMERYAQGHWDLARAIHGLRLLRPCV